MSVIIQLRRDTAANWTSADPILADGEGGYETDTGSLKIGDGATAWTALGYFSTGGGGSHASTHEDGGADEINVTGLSGILVDPQDADTIITTSGPTALVVGAIADGEYTKRVGSTLVGGTPAGGGGISYGFTAPPAAAGWTQVNFGGSDTLTDVTPGEGNAVLLHTVPGGAANDLRVAVIAAPATPYTRTGFFRSNLFISGSAPQFAGLTFRESGTGKLIALNITPAGSDPSIRIINWTNPTTFSSNALTAKGMILGAPFYGFRINDDGTNLKFSFSPNMGASWIEVLSVGRTVFMAGGPDQVGFHTDPGNTGYHQDMALYSWA